MRQRNTKILSLHLSLGCIVLSALTLNAKAHPHHTTDSSLASNSGTAAPATTPAVEVISGKGAFRYRYRADLLPIPAGAEIRHAHGLCRDRDGNIYLAYESSRVNEATRSIIRFRADGKTSALLPTEKRAAEGAPHGLDLHYDAKGAASLYQVNNGRSVFKLNLDGSTVWARTWGPEMGNYKPTDSTVPPGDHRVYVTNGYGDGMIHALHTRDGVYAGHSFGGRGRENGQFNTPHGVTWDARKKLFLIADRGNKRLEYYDLKGQYKESIRLPEITAPCNTDIWGEYLLVPNLDGTVAILDGENAAESVIELSKLLGARGHKHPHDAIFLENGDVVIGTWNPGQVSYWERLTEETSTP